MSQSVRRVLLTSSGLLLCAVRSCYVGEQQYLYESEASGFYVCGSYPDPNMRQIVGVLLFFVSVSLAVAAFMLWRQENDEAAGRFVGRSLVFDGALEVLQSDLTRQSAITKLVTLENSTDTFPDDRDR